MKFSADQVLTERARQLAQRQQGDDLDPSLPTHLRVEAGGATLLLRLESLHGLAQSRLTPVPLATPGLVGVTGFQGQLWPVLGLSEPTDSRPTVVFMAGPVGLMVDHVVGLEWVSGEPGPGPLDQELPAGLSVRGCTPEGWLLLESEL